ncbi:MAG: response regulator [Ignavibacteriae bacterium]|nr:MAG: response regulator [Ignavibacteriota bacterium]
MENLEIAVVETHCEPEEVQSATCEDKSTDQEPLQMVDRQTEDHRLMRKTIENLPQFDVQIGQQHPLRILLAEDSLVNLKITLWFLKKLGYRADVAFNGIEAVDALRRQSYDVVLMDAEMPEMDGREATMLIRKIFPLEMQPHIIAMTANNSPSDRERYQSIGMNDYVTKPLELEEMVRVLLAAPQLPGTKQEQPAGQHDEQRIFSRVA